MDAPLTSRSPSRPSPAPASFSRSSSKVELPKAVKPAVLAAVTNAVVALPSHAGEPGKIFDFNLTLPIIATEFLLLMVILDKTVFGPVGKALDDRDKLIRDRSRPWATTPPPSPISS